MSWDYANLTREAKKHGGPADFVLWIIEEAAKIGRREMLPWMGGAILIGIGLGVAGCCLYDTSSTARLEAEKEKLQKEAEKTLRSFKNVSGSYTRLSHRESSPGEATEAERPKKEVEKNNDSGENLYDRYEMEHGTRVKSLYKCSDCSIQHNRNLAEKAFGEILGTPCELKENASICSQCSTVSRVEEILCRQKDPARIVCSKCGYHENKLYAKKVIDRKYGSGTFDQNYSEENPLCIDCMEDQLAREGFKRIAICEMCGREFIVPRMEGHIGPKYGYAELENIRNMVGNVCDECAMAVYISEHEKDSGGSPNSEGRSAST